MSTLTLITSVLNGMPYIVEAFESIGGEARGHIEHLVVDAGSTDGTLPFLRERRDIWLYERPGLPLYAAWNLAVTEARGDFIGFLNADDVLAPGGAVQILDSIAEAPASEVLCGKADAFVDDGGKGPFSVRYRYDDPAITGPSLDTFLFGAPIINAKIFGRGLFGRVARFDDRLSLAADRNFLLHLLLSRVPVRWRQVSRQFYRYRIHEGSQTLVVSARQRIRIAEEHCVMVDNLLRELPPLDPRSSSKMRALAAREGLVAALCQAKAGKIGQMFVGLSRLAVSDPLFPVRLPLAIAGVAAFRRLAVA